MNKIYLDIVNDVIKSIEKGTPTWRQGVDFSKVVKPINVISGADYRGINHLTLFMKLKQDYRYISFLQAKEKGYKIKKGSKGNPILFFKMLGAKDFKNSEDFKSSKKIPYLKHSTVFNLEDVDGAEQLQDEDKQLEPTESDIVSKIAKDLKIKIVKSRTLKCAFYQTGTDTIAIFPKSFYTKGDEYNATLAHEMIHWTLTKERCNRSLKCRASEELVAELGTLFLFSELRLNVDFPNHASYLDSWTKLLKDKPSALMKSATEASKAVDYLKNNSSTFKELVKSFNKKVDKQ